MNNNLISVRVLQHEKNDQIRIGAKTMIYADQLEKAVNDTISSYEKDCKWCGGFKYAYETYYKRIALVDADSLQVLREITPNNQEE